MNLKKYNLIQFMDLLNDVGHKQSTAETYMLCEYLTEVTARIEGKCVIPLWYSFKSISPSKSEYKTFPVMMEHLFSRIAAGTGC